MSNKLDTHNISPDSQDTFPKQKNVWQGFRKVVDTAGQASTQIFQRSTEASRDFTVAAGQKIQDSTGKMQRKMGEDYYAVLRENPLVLDTISRTGMLTDNKDILRTVFNVPWATTLFWSTAAGSTLALQHSIGQISGQILHYNPGHIKIWNEVNRFMDSMAGSGHRLKFGHSIDYLPQIVERFGVEGVPAYFAHLAQDFTTVDGIPIIPNAWDAKKWLEVKGLSTKAATGLVSMSFSSVLGALAVMTLVHQLWEFGDAAIKKARMRKYLKTASNAVQNKDYNAAVANYKRALEVKRSPAILMSLGQLYMLRPSKRLTAHQSFVEAITLLSDNLSASVPYGKAKLSLRGLAGIQALATSDVLARIHPEYWNDHIQELINAAVFSFVSVAKKQARQGERLISGVLATPSRFSAAINYYLAAKTACYYPFAEDRYRVVTVNIKSALQQLGMIAQYDEIELRQPTDNIKQLWAMELIPPDDVEKELGTYVL